MYWNSRLSREIARYVRRLAEEGYTRRYVNQQRQILGYFAEHCRAEGITSVFRVRTDTALSFLKAYEHLSGSYQSKNWCVLRRFLAEYENVSLLKVRPRIRGTSRVNVDWLTPEECEAVFETAMRPKESLLIGAGLLQGLRRIETIRITAKDAKDALRTGMLRVRGKGGKERAVPLQDEFSMILRSYLSWSNPKSDDQRIAGVGLTCSETILGQFCSRHGRHFGFHTLRRSFGRNLWLLGIPEVVISEILGHASIDMTRKYLGINQSDMRQALSRYKVARGCTITERPEM